MAEPLTPERLDAIEARAVAATPGPWEVHGRGGMGYDVEDALGWMGGIRGQFDREADAAFIAATRTDVPDLVARVRELEAAARALIAHRSSDDGRPWWGMRERGEGWCIACGADVDLWRQGWPALVHNEGCGALALDVALGSDPPA